MAEISFPFENIDTTESQFSSWARNFQETGVQGSPNGTELKVTTPGTGLGVSVAVGQAFIRGHYYINNAAKTLTLTSAGTNTRIDYIVVELDPTANTVVAKIVQGTAVVSSPTAPTLTQTDSGVYQLPVAKITIPNSTINLNSSMITDVRTFMGHRVGIWTTATRPANPTAYQTMGFNQTTSSHEFWTGSAWNNFLAQITTKGDLIVGDSSGLPSRFPIGTGNTYLTNDGSGGLVWGAPAGSAKTVQVFTSSTTWTVPAGVAVCSVYLIGGGGGGGSGAISTTTTSPRYSTGGGGGGGSDLSFFPYYETTPGESITVTVGAGGAGGAERVSPTVSTTGANGSSGSNSSFGDLQSGLGRAGQGGQGGTSISSGYGSGGGYTTGSVMAAINGYFGGTSRPTYDGSSATKLYYSGSNTAAGATAGITFTNATSGIQVPTLAPLTGWSGEGGAGVSTIGGAGAFDFAGYCGGGGAGGVGALVGSNSVTATNGGAGISGAGSGGGAAATSTNSTALSGAGGAAAVNSGAGGGGSGGLQCPGSAVLVGAGGNGGSGLVIVMY